MLLCYLYTLHRMAFWSGWMPSGTRCILSLFGGISRGSILLSCCVYGAILFLFNTTARNPSFMERLRSCLGGHRVLLPAFSFISSAALPLEAKTQSILPLQHTLILTSSQSALLTRNVNNALLPPLPSTHSTPFLTTAPPRYILDSSSPRLNS